MVPGPAIAGSASAATPISSLLAGGAAESGVSPSGDMGALAGQIRQVTQSVNALAESNPALAADIQQIQSALMPMLRNLIMKASQAASVQTPSSEALPMAGS